MPSAGFEPTIPADERPQTYALDRAVTGTGICRYAIRICNTYYFSTATVVTRTLYVNVYTYVTSPIIVWTSFKTVGPGRMIS